MPRRIELQDAADGISGHLGRYAPWEDRRASSVMWECLKDAAWRDTTFHFDMITGLVEPRGRHTARTAAMLPADLWRHVERRRLPRDWVRAASVSVSVAWPDDDTEPIRARLQARILDDRATEHTSTRNLTIDLDDISVPRRPRDPDATAPTHRGPFARLRTLLSRRR